MPSRSEGVRGVLRALVKFVALVAVTGGLGVALGAGLVSVADDVGPKAAPVADGGGGADTTATAPTTTNRRTTGTATTSTGTVTSRPPATTTTPSDGPLAQVGVRILGAILHPAGTPDGMKRRRARLTMRVRAINRAGIPVAMPTPVVGVGSVRIRTDSAAETDATRFGELAVGETKSVTLRFELRGEATEKITIDRRARLSIAGRSMAFRLKLGSPVKPPENSAADGTQTTPATTQTTP